MTRNYNDPLYEEARKKVLKRDKYTCQMPGCKSKRRLNVHHIIPWSRGAMMRYETYNLITLCRKCHDGIKDLEHHYVNLFTDIVRDNENPKRL